MYQYYVSTNVLLLILNCRGRYYFFFMSRTTPWADSQEWLEVFTKLYSPEDQQKLLGVRRVKAWANRAKLPQSVEATANLVEVGLQDQRNSTCSERELSLLICMALIRFVNGVVDAAQKGNVAASALGIAEQLDLPIWLVEIRHQATHDRIPPISQLRPARLRALEWLRVQYWEVQATAVQDTEETLLGLLTAYHDTRRGILMNGENGTAKLQKLLHSLTSMLTSDNYPGLLFPALLQPGLLVSLDSEHQVGYNTEYLEDDYIIKIWEPLLRSCETKWNGFSGSLFQYILDEYRANSEHEIPLYWSTLNTWCKFLISQFMLPSESYQCDLLVKNCMREPDQFTMDILAYIDHLDRMPDHLKHMYALLQEKIRIDDMFAKGKLGSSMVSVEKVDVHVENLYQELEEISKRVPKQVSTERTTEIGVKGWEVISSWAKSPIGLIPGLSRVTNLELDPSYDDLSYLQEQGILYIPSEHQIPSNRAAHSEDMMVDNVFLI
jgi:hypothetical protein